MARSRITATSQDLISDSGSVFWSIIRGEQLELPIELSFLKNAADPNLEYEAVVVEGDNDGAGTRPIGVLQGGVQNSLTLRLPYFVGEWVPTDAYSQSEVVRYGSVFYEKSGGTAVIDATPPSESPDWEVTTLNKVYIQFPKTLSISPAWAVEPSVDAPVYGFFELRITEKTSGTYPRTWKPARGMVEILFSPTELVPD